MAKWKMYEIVLRLQSPLHAGHAKWGNLLITAPCVPARALWGALTAFLTREMHTRPTGTDYQETGVHVQKSLAFTYFFPCLKSDQAYTCYFPWESEKNEVPFRARFIGSYVSTALQGEQKAAEEASLHEIEFLSPFTRDGTGKPVCLMGYIFSKADSSKDKVAALLAEILSNPAHEFWQNAQLGAERTYGWGRTRCESIHLQTSKCWNRYSVRLEGDRPLLHVASGQPIPAPLIFHEQTVGKVTGTAQPLVRRAWGQHPGEQIVFDGVAFPPGSLAKCALALALTDWGYLCCDSNFSRN